MLSEAPGYLERALGVVCPADRDFADYSLEYLTDPEGTIQRQHDRETAGAVLNLKTQEVDASQTAETSGDQAAAAKGMTPAAKAALFSRTHPLPAASYDASPKGIALEPGASMVQYASNYHLSMWRQLLVCTARTVMLQFRDRHNYLKCVRQPHPPGPPPPQCTDVLVQVGCCFSPAWDRTPPCVGLQFHRSLLDCTAGRLSFKSLCKASSPAPSTGSCRPLHTCSASVCSTRWPPCPSSPIWWKSDSCSPTKQQLRSM
jgi:hypothetical protein